MPNPRLAGRYAKSILGLAVEKDQLEAVYNDMIFLKSVTDMSKDFVVMLQSPVIKSDKKQHILDAVTKNRVSSLTSAFNTLLIKKGRESDLPEIISAFIGQYNAIKGIHKVKLVTAEPASEELKRSIIEKLKKEANLEHIELETKVDNKIIGGFILEFNNNLLDASVLRDLNDVKKQFKENIYIQQIR